MEIKCDYCGVSIEPTWEYCICCKKTLQGRPFPVAKKSNKVSKFRTIIYARPVKTTESPKNKTPELPLQPQPINIDNFFIRTKGVFEKLDSIPAGFTKFFSSKKSHYYTNEKQTKLVRVSDHWGYAIRYCAWHLKGHKKISSWRWSKHYGNKEMIGVIHFKDLEVNRTNA